MSLQPALHDVRPVQKEASGKHHLLDDFVGRHSGEREGATKHPFEGVDAFILKDVLTEEQCAELRGASGEMGYSFWNPSPDCSKRYRNAETVEIHHQGLADLLWDRMKDSVIPEITFDSEDPRCDRGMEGTWRASGINPTLLFAYYPEGGHFSPHTDGYTIIDYNTRSLFSVLVYLNTCSVGGGTALLNPQEGYHLDESERFRWAEEANLGVAPVETGTVLAFFQDIHHEGQPVGEGQEKFIIRTDVMFERTPKECDSEAGRKAYETFRQAELLEAEDPFAAVKLFQKIPKLCPELAEALKI